MLVIFLVATIWLLFLNLGRFHNFCQIVRTALHLALVPHMAGVYSAARVDRRRHIRFRWPARGGGITMGASAKPQDTNGEISISDFDLDPLYVPGDDEPFMSERQLRYFEKQLVDWKNSILAEAQGTLNQLQDGPMREPDLNDRASSETDWGIELRTRDRQRKLIAKIDAALRRIGEGEYGYCQVTGEPISLARLRARPIATMTLEAQERHERQERVSRDD